MSDTDGYRCNSHRRDGTFRTKENCVECAYDEGRDRGWKMAMIAMRDALKDLSKERAIYFDGRPVMTTWTLLSSDVLDLFAPGGKFEVEE